MAAEFARMCEGGICFLANIAPHFNRNPLADQWLAIFSGRTIYVPCSADDETGMAYDSLAFNQRDPLVIDIGAEFEARYWSRVLGISRIKLREAISVSGSCNAYVVAHCAGCDLTALTKQKD